MSIHYQNHIKVIVIAMFVVVAVFSGRQAFAATPPRGLTISPLQTELTIAPGNSQHVKLTITNQTDAPMTVDLSAEQFSVTNAQYDYAFDATSDLAGWVNFQSSQLALAKGESKDVDAQIAVPLSAEPGGRYISLFASTKSDANSQGVTSIQRVASLVYITVSGNVTRIGHLVSLTSPYVTVGSVDWNAVIQNSGTAHFTSQYTVTVQTLFGGTVSTASGQSLILPSTIRAVTNPLSLPQFPGIYKVTYVIGLGDTPEHTEVHYLVYLPISSIAFLIVLIALFALIIRRRWKKH